MPMASVSKALISCDETVLPLNPGINIKKAAAQESMATREKTTKGMVSFGSLPWRKNRGILHRMSRMIKGKIEKGVTMAPDMDDNSGRDVKGRPINPMAQKNSQIFSIDFQVLFEVVIMQSSKIE